MILIADKHKLTRDGIAAILGGDTAQSDGSDLRDQIRRLKPEIVVSSVEFLSSLTTNRSVVYANESPRAYLRDALMSVNGYIHTNCSAEELIECVNIVRKGGKYVAKDLLPFVIDGYLESDDSPLSKRERDVIMLLAGGASVNSASKTLFVSPKTIRTHRASIMSKLGLKSDVDLVKFAVQNNLVEL